MTRDELIAAVTATKTETHDALALLYGELNKGQQKKILKNEEVKKLLIRYKVIKDG